MNTAPNIDTVWLTRSQLAKRWQTTEATLRQDASHGRGIRFAKLGRRVRYALADVLEYEAAAYVEHATKA